MVEVGHSPLRLQFNPTAVHMQFMVDKVALGQAFLQILPFPCQHHSTESHIHISFTSHQFHIILANGSNSDTLRGGKKKLRSVTHKNSVRCTFNDTRLIYAASAAVFSIHFHCCPHPHMAPYLTHISTVAHILEQYRYFSFPQ